MHSTFDDGRSSSFGLFRSAFSCDMFIYKCICNPANLVPCATKPSWKEAWSHLQYDIKPRLGLKESRTKKGFLKEESS